MERVIQHLLIGLDEAYREKSWHGTNLSGALRGLSQEELAWRPQASRHNIWEIAVHAAYWKYAVRRRLLGLKRGSFALSGSDWFPRPQVRSRQAWEEDLALLDTEHFELRKAVAGLDAESLEQPLPRARVSAGFLVRGVIAHDLYHAGQIQLIKKMCRETYG